MAPSSSKPPSRQFTTIKVSESLRRWIKMEAARRDVPMYLLLEQLVAKAERGRPWERAG
jgi:hypothetical protein